MGFLTPACRRVHGRSCGETGSGGEADGLGGEAPGLGGGAGLASGAEDPRGAEAADEPGSNPGADPLVCGSLSPAGAGLGVASLDWSGAGACDPVGRVSPSDWRDAEGCGDGAVEADSAAVVGAVRGRSAPGSAQHR